MQSRIWIRNKAFRDANFIIKTKFSGNFLRELCTVFVAPTIYSTYVNNVIPELGEILLKKYLKLFSMPKELSFADFPHVS